MMKLNKSMKTTMSLATAMKINHIKLLPTALAAIACIGSASAAVVQIGAGADLAGAVSSDSAGEDRLNVALTSPAGNDFVNLAAGTYNVVDFQLNVNDHTAGTVAPMLLSGSAGNFTTLWVGGDIDPASNGILDTDYTPGTQTITLAVATDVYAGIFTQNQGSAIPLINLSVGTISHDNNGFTAPTGPGDTVDGFSHSTLGRAYAFEINVESVPEPSTTALLGLGGLALILRRRK